MAILMIYYENELKALKKSGRYRERKILDTNLKDFASNDYLGLAHNKDLHKKTCQELEKLPSHSAKASLLVNGYHQIHKDFEDALCEANNFEDAVVVGSGFNANIAMIEALCRKGDMLFMDELYHASGVLATQLEHVNVVFFKHNDMEDLQKLLDKHNDVKRKIIAVEGIYSMDGDLCDQKVFEIADCEDAILIVDEAHSSGVVGEKLMGVFDLYSITPKPNHIKMGTLGKAYGGFGAYILASSHIIEYLINRAKPIIYATALSLYDTLLAHRSLEYIIEHREELLGEINLRKMIVQRELGISIDGLIVPIVIGDNKKVLEIKEILQQDGYSIGAIRQPTVDQAILRLIARLGESETELIALCKKINKTIN
jgi:8-amino-7-oxononanoate synthase